MAEAEGVDAEVQGLAEQRVLGALLDRVRQLAGGYDLLNHHQQCEFHDVKEVLCFCRTTFPRRALALALSRQS